MAMVKAHNSTRAPPSLTMFSCSILTCISIDRFPIHQQVAARYRFVLGQHAEASFSYLVLAHPSTRGVIPAPIDQLTLSNTS